MPRHSHTAATVLLSTLVASVLTLSACGPGAPASSNGAANSTGALGAQDPNGSSERIAGINTTVTPGLAPLGSADASPKTQRPEAPSQLQVKEVRTGTHDIFDRIVFDLEGNGQPGWFIDYTDTPISQTTGKQIPFNGAIALNVNIDGTIAPSEPGEAASSIDAAQSSGVINQIIAVGTSDGRTQFIIGLERKAPYSVELLDNPQRLVIDIVPD